MCLTHRKANLLVSLLFLLGPIQQLCFSAQSSAAATANVPARPPTQDIGWPRQISQNGATLIYYQPQIDDWKDYQELFCRVAFSLTPAGGKAVLGVASIQANTLVDKESRTVYLRDIRLTSARFPSLDADAAAVMEKLLKQMVPQGGEPISVDRLIADLEKGKTPAQPVAVDNNPPRIFWSDKPGI